VDYGGDPGAYEVASLGRSAPRGDVLAGWDELRATRTEIVSIRDSFEQRFPDGSVRMLRDAGATEGAVRTAAPSHRYLHLATHGYFAPAKLRSMLAQSADDARQRGFATRQDVAGYHPGLLSGIVLAGANRPIAVDRDDGILTALEVGELNLSLVELVTLSACETGLGQAAGGEGVLGLQRAFQVAGAKTVVASLWSVRDDATRSLMIDFYDNLWNKKLSKIEALRQAQLTMLREGIHRGLKLEDNQQPADNRLPPYYWAAFVLSGDWR
jgi:CHAT domain-containing protein